MSQTAIDGVEGLNRAGELGELGRFSRSRQLMWGSCAVSDLVVYFLPPECAGQRRRAARIRYCVHSCGRAVAGIVGVVLECFGISKLL